MFEAFILVCSLLPNAEPPCVELHDRQGPYKTEEQCKARIGEMAYDLVSFWTKERMPMAFRMTSCVHPDELIEKTQV